MIVIVTDVIDVIDVVGFRTPRCKAGCGYHWPLDYNISYNI